MQWQRDVYLLLNVKIANRDHDQYGAKQDREDIKYFAKLPRLAKTASILGLKSAVEIEGVFRFSLFFPRKLGA